jgi:hypothetical protein
MVCGRRQALPTQPTMKSTCTEVNVKREGFGTDNYPSVRSNSQWQIHYRESTIANSFGLKV